MQAEGGVPKPCPEPCPQVGNSDLREPGGAAGKTCQPSGTRPPGRNSQAEGRGFETRRPLRTAPLRRGRRSVVERQRAVARELHQWRRTLELGVLDKLGLVESAGVEA